MLQERLKNNLIEKCLLQSNTTVIVAVSGGPDSIALLHLLYSLRRELHLTLVVAHIDHGLRPSESSEEQNLISSLCKEKDLPCDIYAVDARSMQKERKNSLEESCRILRYQALEKCREQYGARYIAVAHNADDQAEEVLLRLIRGTGLTGLSGMRWKNGAVIRPLLNIPKQEILAYLARNTLCYAVDSSNQDTRFLRNRIRHKLIPALQENYNPAIKETLLQLTDILFQDDAYINRQVQHSFAGCCEINEQGGEQEKIVVQSQPFKYLHPALQRRIIEQCCNRKGLRPTYHHITSLCNMACTGKTGAEIHLGNKLSAVKTAETLVFFHSKSQGSRGSISHSVTIPEDIVIAGEETDLIVNKTGYSLRIEKKTRPPEDSLEGQLILDADKVTFPLHLRSHKQGEIFTPSGMRGRKKVATFFRDCKIPKHDRKNFPVLVQDDTIIAVLGQRIAAEVQPSVATVNFLVITWKPSMS